MINTNDYRLYIASFKRAASDYLNDESQFHVKVDIPNNIITITLELSTIPEDEEISIMETEMMADFQCDNIRFYLSDSNVLTVEIKENE